MNLNTMRWQRRVMHPRPWRPRYVTRLEALEDRLPPGDTVLGGLLAWSWTDPTPLSPTLAPDGGGSSLRWLCADAGSGGILSSLPSEATATPSTGFSAGRDDR